MACIEKFATKNDLSLEAPRASKKRKPIRNTALKDFVVDGTVVGQGVDVADDGMTDKLLAYEDLRDCYRCSYNGDGETVQQLGSC